ncbi:MAG: hypothetical protein U1A81_13680, partial [Hydrogenophaga sp.]|nr:hypothetical protein [Hydrogenophaga sp.]
KKGGDMHGSMIQQVEPILAVLSASAQTDEREVCPTHGMRGIGCWGVRPHRLYLPKAKRRPKAPFGL